MAGNALTRILERLFCRTRPISDEALIAALNQIGEAVLVAQADAAAAKHLARELIVDLARLRPDPDAYLAALYDRVIAYVDPAEHVPEKEATAMTRDLIGAIFRDGRASLSASDQK